MMKRLLSLIILGIISACQLVSAQSQTFDKVFFFIDTSVIDATITTNTRKLFGINKDKGFSLPANFTASLDGKNINDRILLEVRGHFRRENCYLPPLKINFKLNPTATLSPLKSLKLVSQCQSGKENEQFLLKEFLIYKIYNLLTDKSFRVKLLNLNFADSSGRKKNISEYAFLIEDINDMAKRNNCSVWKKSRLYQETTERRQMTIVSIFEYMIGNTDWSVSEGHNTCLILATDDSKAIPMVVPYDFDFSGLVGTEYSVPDEKLVISNVKQRLYRGYPRTIEEINEVLDIFRQQKENIYSKINNFNLLNPDTKKNMTGYLDEFYSTINNPRDVVSIFIENARKD